MRKFLLYSSALVLGLSGGVAEAACIQTPTCSSLGYTSTSSCTGGTKCPFGNYWNCTASDLNDKITELETKITELKKEVTTAGCLVGAILYSDLSCKNYLDSSKTPIGVIFDIGQRLAVALEQKEEVAWSTTNFDIPALMPYVDYTADKDGKKNTKAIYDYCKANNKSCPAVEYAYTYKTEGTQAGDWYLPSAVELRTLLANFTTINASLAILEKTQLTASTKEGTPGQVVGGGIIPTIYNYYYYWSSTSVLDTATVYYYYSNDSSFYNSSIAKTFTSFSDMTTKPYYAITQKRTDSRPILQF